MIDTDIPVRRHPVSLQLATGSQRSSLETIDEFLLEDPIPFKAGGADTVPCFGVVRNNPRALPGIEHDAPDTISGHDLLAKKANAGVE